MLLQFPREKDKYTNPHDVYCPFEYGKTPVNHCEAVRVFLASTLTEIEETRDLVPMAPIFRNVPQALQTKIHTENRKQTFPEWQLRKGESSKEMMSVEKELKKTIENLESHQDNILDDMIEFNDEMGKDSITNWINLVRREERLRELLNDQKKS